MRCTKNYQNCLQVSVDDVEKAGFEVKIPKRKCETKYYVSEKCEYVLAVTKHKRKIILDKETYDIYGDSSIYTNNKGRNYKSVGGILIYVEEDERSDDYSYVPRIRTNGKDKMLHRVVMGDPEDKQVDHINHNQSCCIKENLRVCVNGQNTRNRKDKCGISEYSDMKGNVYYAYDDVLYDSKVDCYLAYRDSAREQYKGTDMEEFVYNIENDFSETIGLLIHHYIIQDISKEEMYQMNLDYWRDKLDNASGLRVAI